MEQALTGFRTGNLLRKIGLTDTLLAPNRVRTQVIGVGLFPVAAALAGKSLIQILFTILVRALMMMLNVRRATSISSLEPVVGLTMTLVREVVSPRFL